MKKHFLTLIFLFFLISGFSVYGQGNLPGALEADSRNFKSAMSEIPVGNNSLWIRIYVFNDWNEGKKIAEEIYGVKNYDSIAVEEDFRRLKRMIPGDVIQGFEYGMFGTESEFWVLRNRGDGYLYGTGRYIKR